MSVKPAQARGAASALRTQPKRVMDGTGLAMIMGRLSGASLPQLRLQSFTIFMYMKTMNRMSPAPGTSADTPAPRGFAHVDAWIFDLDNTLYSHEAQVWPQVGQRITRFLAETFDLDGISARALQKYYYHRHGTTLRGLMEEHGMDPTDFLAFVHDVDLSLLPANERLAAAIGALPGRKLIFTNGSARHAENICRKLGLDSHFCGYFDIVAADFIPKPEQGAYDMLLAQYDVDPARAAFFEDMARNLAPAHALGMTTALVLPATPDPYREPFEQAREELAHVDHITDDLSGFLEGVIADSND